MAMTHGILSFKFLTRMIWKSRWNWRKL